MPVPGHAWQHVGGVAADIAVSAGGNVYHSSPNNNRIYLWDGDGDWIDTGMETSRPAAIAGGPNGSVWFVGLYGGLHSWEPRVGHIDLGIWADKDDTLDLAVTPGGKAWVAYEIPGLIATRVARWDADERRWRSAGKGLHKLAACDTEVWGTDSPDPDDDSNLCRWSDNRFEHEPGWGFDVGIGPRAELWHVGRNGIPHYRDGGDWLPAPLPLADPLHLFGSRRIAVGPQGLAWCVVGNALFRRT